jgi:TRAP transporter TAXI family solute receptor
MEMVYYWIGSPLDTCQRGRNPLIRLSTTFLIGILSIVYGAGVLAEQAPVNLCTGGPEGNYFATGRDIAAHASPKFVKVSVVQTEGSMDNMQRLARSECGAAIVQSDAYLVYQTRHRDRPVEVTRNRFLYAEFVHLVCRRDAKVASIGDLLANPGRHKILVGPEESGSAVTWRAFTILDRRFSQMPAENVGGEAALNRVLGGQAQCMFFVAGLGSKLGKDVDRAGKDLQLVPITEDVLRNAQFGSTTLYETRHIPRNSYRNLEAGLPEDGVATLTVAATLIIDRRWADRYRNGPSGLLGGVTGAMPAISKRAMSGFN